MRDRLRRAVSDEDKREAAQAFADTALQLALDGDVAWAKVLLDRAYGAVAVPLTGADGGPISFVQMAQEIARRPDDDTN